MNDRMNRRRWLETATAASAPAAAATALNATSFAQPSKGSPIDAHSHIWTRDVQKYPLAKGQTVDDLKPPSFTAEELLETAHAVGVRRVVLIAHNIYYGFDNGYMIDSARRYPGTFKIVGMVDDSMPHPDDAMRLLLPHQVTGFRITPFVSGPQWLESDGMKAMWRCGAETRQAMCCLINPEHLPQVFQMCAKFPATPVVIDHFARIGVDGEVRDADLDQLCRLAQFKHTYVKISAFYALGRKRPPYEDLIPMIRRLYEVFGPRRLMWASDAPYQVVNGHSYAASIELVRDRLDFVSDADRQWLLEKTAANVYFWDA